MNPVLLKPQSDTGAQVVVQGRVLRSCSARDYHALKPQLLPRVLESFARLRAAADLVLVEGAGSPAEVNLRDGDIANMGFARAAGVPVVLAGDIERGGVIAQLVGTRGTARARGARPAGGLCGQQVPRRPRVVRRRPPGDRGSAPACAPWAWSPGSSRRAPCPRRTCWAWPSWPGGRRPAGRHRRACRICRGWPISTIWTRWRPTPR